MKREVRNITIGEARYDHASCLFNMFITKRTALGLIRQFAEHLESIDSDNNIHFSVWGDIEDEQVEEVLQ